MAKDQISREIFDAMMQEMIGNYSVDRYDEPRRSGPSRSTPRSQRYEDNGRYHRDAPIRSPRDEYRSRAPESRRSYPGPPRRDFEEEPYHSYPDRRRSGSPSRSRDRYYSEYREPDYGYSRSRDASWSEEPEYYHSGHQEHGPYRERGIVSPRERGGGYNQRGWVPRGRGGVQSPRGANQGPRGRGINQSPRGRGGNQIGRGAVQSRGRGTFVPRGRGAYVQNRGKPINQRGRGGKQGPTRGGGANERAPAREQSLKALMEKAGALSDFESQVIRWAGFNEVSDTEFTPKNPSHSTLETDTCINTLTSFRCFFKPELRYYCFLTVRTLNHSALKKPKIDGDFFQLLIEKGAVPDKFSFSKIINPLDKHLTIFQTYLLKSAHPLLLACNEHELNLKKAGGDDDDDAAATAADDTIDQTSALEKSVALCRKGLVLLGQTFAVVTTYRQDKILEAAGLNESAPKPSEYPNLDDSLLFGKEYMARLKSWLDESGHQIKVKSDQVVGQKDLKPEPKVKDTLDTLLENAINAWKEREAEREKAAKEAELKEAELKEAELKAAETKKEAEKEAEMETEKKDEEKEDESEVKEEKEAEDDKADKEKEAEMESEEEKEPEKEKPDFWFLFDEDSQEYKYYQLKLAEIQKLKREAEEAKLKAAEEKLKAAQLAAAEKAAAEVAAAEKVAAEKRAIEKAAAQKAAAEKKAAQKAAAEKAAAEKAAEKASSDAAPKKNIVKGVTPAKQKKQKKAATKALTGILKKTAKPAASSKSAADSEFPDLEEKVKETAENLARFIVQMGTDAEDFNMESLNTNPEFWFLTDEESPAHKYYQMKLTEIRESTDLSESTELKDSDPTKSDSQDAEPQGNEQKDKKSKDKAQDSDSQDGPQASETQDNEESQEQMECEATESAGSDGATQSASSTPARSPLTRKRGRPVRGKAPPAAKRVCPAEESKVEEPIRVGNEKPSGRPALRKKQTKKETVEQSVEDDGIKVGDTSGEVEELDE